MSQASRKTCLEMQEGKAAEFTVTVALDYYRESYQKQFQAMLRGEVYSQGAMDNALENIMRIAVDDEAHQNYGEAVEAEEAADWMREPTDAQLLAIQQENEIASYDFLNDEESCQDK